MIDPDAAATLTRHADNKTRICYHPNGICSEGARLVATFEPNATGLARLAFSSIAERLRAEPVDAIDEDDDGETLTVAKIVEGSVMTLDQLAEAGLG